MPEPFFDYLLLPYRPVGPTEGKLRSGDLLAESFALADIAERGRALVEALHRAVGPFRTVWGIKHAAASRGELSWEFYFYRRDGGRGEPTLDGVLAALEPAVRVPARPVLPPRWELFSVELTAAEIAAGEGGELDVYVGMRAYRARGRELEYKNQYLFDDPGLRLDRMLERLLVAVHAPHDAAEISRVLPFELIDGCVRLCVANKRRADGVYFSHLRLAQLAWFLETHAWPAGLRRWVDGNADRLDHLLWDAGYDFRRAGRELEIFRSGFYGFV